MDVRVSSSAVVNLIFFPLGCFLYLHRCVMCSGRQERVSCSIAPQFVPEFMEVLISRALVAVSEKLNPTANLPSSSKCCVKPFSF